MGEEGLEKTAHNEIFVAEPLNITMKDINMKMEVLNNLLNQKDIKNEEIKNTFKELVPTFKEPEKVNN